MSKIITTYCMPKQSCNIRMSGIVGCSEYHCVLLFILLPWCFSIYSDTFLKNKKPTNNPEEDIKVYAETLMKQYEYSHNRDRNNTNLVLEI